jgi:hypothetical protein
MKEANKLTVNTPCHDCGVLPGQLHDLGCDVEQCPRCGGQLISCKCIYEINGMNGATLESEHPQIYENGPTDEMYEKFDDEWGERRIAWSGEWPGFVECREFGWYAKRNPSGPGYIRCDKDDPDASEDLNRLDEGEAEWSVKLQRWILKNA